MFEFPRVQLQFIMQTKMKLENRNVEDWKLYWWIAKWMLRKCLSMSHGAVVEEVIAVSIPSERFNDWSNIFACDFVKHSKWKTETFMLAKIIPEYISIEGDFNFPIFAIEFKLWISISSKRRVELYSHSVWYSYLVAGRGENNVWGVKLYMISTKEIEFMQTYAYRGSQTIGHEVKLINFLQL